MANPTYKLIASQTVGAGGVASVTFSSIPQTYTDLKIVMSARASSGNPGFWLNFNGSTSNFTGVYLEGNGASAASGTATTATLTVNPSTATSSVFTNSELYIPNYTSSNYKSVSGDGVTENNGTTAYQDLQATLWSNSAAITSINIACGSGPTFVQYSTFYLYGINNS